MNEENAVKLKPFSGNDENWVFWLPMFLARVNTKAYCRIAEGDKTATTIVWLP